VKNINKAVIIIPNKIDSYIEGDIIKAVVKDSNEISNLTILVTGTLNQTMLPYQTYEIIYFLKSDKYIFEAIILDYRLIN
jgi:hypothetical protein